MSKLGSIRSVGARSIKSIVKAVAPSVRQLYRSENAAWFGGYGSQEQMLADTSRMDFYAGAIAHHVNAGDRVIDLGTGTGVLAAFASRQGASKVYALDHSDILETAILLGKHNALENIDYVQGHSSKFQLDEKVDVILHEQMGEVLFDEDMVFNIIDLRDRLLKPGGLILPGNFDLFCEPVKIKEDSLRPFIWNMNVHGFDCSPTKQMVPGDPSYYHYKTHPEAVDYSLCSETPVLSVDLHTINESTLASTLEFTHTVEHAGRMDGYAVYFRTKSGNDLELHTGPFAKPRCNCWTVRILRTEPVEYKQGDVIEGTLSAEHWPALNTWKWT
ncbi:MAG: 50S ribosomal protein L11 methyltransferase [Pseudomonadales bacterium]